MRILDVKQGSSEWHAVRATRRCASDAPAVMGVGKYVSRSELLRQKASGLTPEIDSHQQALFDRGHAAEAAASALAEATILDDLYPVTCVSDDDLYLASMDGLTMDEAYGFEHKLVNAGLVRQIRAQELEPHYYWQLEHQLMVTGAKRILFVASDGTAENFHSMYYSPVAGRREALIAGWEQFAADLAAYTPAEVLPVAVAAPQPSLPAVVVRMDGALTVASNLPDFAVALRAYIERIPANPETDQQFADAEAACSALKKAEDALEQAENNALSQMVDVEQMRRVVGDLRALSRTTRLATEKLVKARKESIRTEIYQEGIATYKAHIDGLNKRIGHNYMPALPVDFAGAIKNKRTVDSLRDAVNTHLANAKIAANDVADKISLNLTTLREFAGDRATLFPDVAQLVLKANDDLKAMVNNRIAEHTAAEQRRADELAEKARAKIRDEEAAKLRAEQDRIERQRAADAARDKDEAERASRVSMSAIAAKAEPDTRTAEALALAQVQAPAVKLAIIEPRQWIGGMTARNEVEQMIKDCVPGGDTCDPQQIADALRTWALVRYGGGK